MLEDRGRLAGRARAVRPGGDPEAAIVERHAHDLGVQVRDREAHEVRDTLGGVAVDPRALDAFGDAGADRVGERPLPCRLVVHALETSLERRGHRGDPRDVLHARATTPLAVVPAGVRGDRHATANVERPDPRRSPELVSRDRQQVDVECHRVDRQVTDGLAGVRVEQHARLAAQPGALGDRLDRSRPRGSRGARTRGACPGGGSPPANASRSIEPLPSTSTSTDSNPSVSSVWSTPPTAGCSIVVVTIAGAELADRSDAAPDRERHRFGPAAREHDLVGLGSRARRRPWRVRRRAVVAPPARPRARAAGRRTRRARRATRPRALVQRGRGRVIEVGARGHHGERPHDTGAPVEGCVRAWPAPGPSGTPWRTGPPR